MPNVSLAEVIALLAYDVDGKPSDWIVGLTKGVRPAVPDHLVETGMLRRDPGKLVRILPHTRYPAPDGVEPAIETAARRQMRAAATGSEPVDARTAVLCGLVSAMGWAHLAVPDLPPRRVDTRFADLRRTVWAAEVVKKIIDETARASTAATVAAAATA